MDSHVLEITFRVWFAEILASGVNDFVLMRRVCEPRVGVLRAHRIGMRTRMGHILIPFAFVLALASGIDSVPGYLLAGAYWVLMVLAFEWIGSFVLRRPVHEIHEGRRARLPVAARAADLSALVARRRPAAERRDLGGRSARSKALRIASASAGSGRFGRPSCAR